MAAVTVCSGFAVQENKICHCFQFSSFYLPWSDGTRCHDLSFWILNCKADFSVSSFTLIKTVFSFSSLSALKVTSSTSPRLLIFLLPNLISCFDLSSLGFCMMYSAYELNKLGDNIQPFHIPVPVVNQSLVSYLVLTVACSHAYRFQMRRVGWSGIPISWRIFHSLLWSTESKALA